MQKLLYSGSPPSLFSTSASIKGEKVSPQPLAYTTPTEDYLHHHLWDVMGIYNFWETYILEK